MNHQNGRVCWMQQSPLQMPSRVLQLWYRWNRVRFLPVPGSTGLNSSFSFLLVTCGREVSLRVRATVLQHWEPAAAPAVLLHWEPAASPTVLQYSKRLVRAAIIFVGTFVGQGLEFELLVVVMGFEMFYSPGFFVPAWFRSYFLVLAFGWFCQARQGQQL